MSFKGKLLLIGPLPPPYGGMANQTAQLARLLRETGVKIELVQTNSPYRPSWIGHVRGLRAVFRLGNYFSSLWRAIDRADTIHLMANSGLSWHLFAVPAIWIARIRKKPILINYRGGKADEFLRYQALWVLPSLRSASCLVVPSGFLQSVFGNYGLKAAIIPNIVDIDRFPYKHIDHPQVGKDPHIVVTRNLEEIYQPLIALEAFYRIAMNFPSSHLTIAGEGPERAKLERRIEQLGLENQVSLTGGLVPEQMTKLYQSADVLLNTSKVDNTPNSLIEAMAVGVAIVTTRAGGIPFLVEENVEALMAEVGDIEQLSQSIVRLLTTPGLYSQLVISARRKAEMFSWREVKPIWLSRYQQLITIKN